MRISVASLRSRARHTLRSSYRLTWRYESWRFAREQDHALPPLVIYQMGKVGSASVYRALTGLRGSYSLYHVHTLRSDEIASTLETYRRAYGVRRTIPVHIIASQRLRQDIADGQPRGRWKVVTLIRDPIARDISSFFQTLTLNHPEFATVQRRAAHDRRRLVQELLATYLDNHDHWSPLGWLERELESILGVDVYSRPFPHDRGWDVFQGERADVLLIRLEDLTQCMPAAISSFLDGFEPSVTVTNAAEDKRYSQLYQEFRNELRLPESYVSQMYESRMVRHFYTPDEVEHFIARWSAVSRPGGG